MNKIWFLKLIFIFLMGFCACKNHTQNHKTEILPMDSVAAVVADCLFLEGEIYVKQWTYDIKDYSLVKYDSFFEKRGITKEQFVHNVRHYFLNKRYAETIMNKVDTIVEGRVAILRDALKNEQ